MRKHIGIVAEAFGRVLSAYNTLDENKVLLNLFFQPIVWLWSAEHAGEKRRRLPRV